MSYEIEIGVQLAQTIIIVVVVIGVVKVVESIIEYLATRGFH